jgi:hypothetical protein
MLRRFMSAGTKGLTIEGMATQITPLPQGPRPRLQREWGATSAALAQVRGMHYNVAIRTDLGTQRC